MLSTVESDKTKGYSDGINQLIINKKNLNKKESKKDVIWKSIFQQKNLFNHNFKNNSVLINSDELRNLTIEFTGSAKEPRILCRHICPKELPILFLEKNIFCLPVKNKEYRLVKGNPFTYAPPITSTPITLHSNLYFPTVCGMIGDSEMQHLDHCFNSGILNHFLNTHKRLIQTMRGRKYCRSFNFFVEEEQIFVEGVQYETDAVYETEDEIIICEAKNFNVEYIHNRQLFYPYKDIIQYANGKPIRLILFCHKNGVFSLWEYTITDEFDFNSIQLLNSEKYIIGNTNNNLFS